MSKSETHFEIPQVMDASDMAISPDELSVMTYVSYFRGKAETLAAKGQSGGKSFAEGPGLEPGIVDDGKKREFTVHALTDEGNPMVKEDSDTQIVEVSIIDPQGNDVKCEIADPVST